MYICSDLQSCGEFKGEANRINIFSKRKLTDLRELTDHVGFQAHMFSTSGSYNKIVDL